MWRRFVFTLVLVFLAAVPAMGQKWAKDMFEQTEHDFGYVARGAKTEFSFVLSNLYLEDVHIASVRSSCGCTTPRIENDSLETYEKGAIVAKFNTDRFTGSKGATLTVTFDKPFPAEVQLHVSGYIRNDVVLNPESVRLTTVEQGTAADAKTTITYSGRSDWKVLEVKSANPHITAHAVETTRTSGRVAYELQVHLDENAPVGYLSDHLMLVTNDRQSPQVPVHVEGQVTSAIMVSPVSLFMGTVEPGQKVTKQLVVKGKQPFRIVAIDCDNESFSFGATTDDPPKALHLIPVTFTAGTDAGKVTQTIRIETDLADSIPELPAYAVVSPP